MRIAVTGKSGQLATSLIERGEAHGADIVALGRPELDLSAPHTIGPALRAADPDLIVSAAAYTAVDKAESEPDAAFAINAEAPGEIARVAAALGVPLIHLSTDYVFDGQGEGYYREDAATAPLGVYGKSKRAGELAVAAGGGQSAIVRTAWVYSPFGHNFLKTMLRLAGSRPTLRVVDDQRGSPTSALDLADGVLRLAQSMIQRSDLSGIFHMTGSGEASWAEFAAEIFRLSRQAGGVSATVEPIPASQYPTPAPRPTNSRLCNDRLAATTGIVLPAWQSSTDTVIRRLLAAGAPL